MVTIAKSSKKVYLVKPMRKKKENVGTTGSDAIGAGSHTCKEDSIFKKSIFIN